MLVAIPIMTLMSTSKCKPTHSFTVVSHLSPRAKVQHETRNMSNLIAWFLQITWTESVTTSSDRQKKILVPLLSMVLYCHMNFWVGYINETVQPTYFLFLLVTSCDPFHQVHDVGIWKPVTWCLAQQNYCRNICQQQTCHIFITTRRWDSKRAWWNCVLWYVGLFNVIICNVCIHSEHVMYTCRQIIRVEHDWTKVSICKDLVDFRQSARRSCKKAFEHWPLIYNSMLRQVFEGWLWSIGHWKRSPCLSGWATVQSSTQNLQMIFNAAMAQSWQAVSFHLILHASFTRRWFYFF